MNGVQRPGKFHSNLSHLGSRNDLFKLSGHVASQGASLLPKARAELFT